MILSQPAHWRKLPYWIFYLARILRTHWLRVLLITVYGLIMLVWAITIV